MTSPDCQSGTERIASVIDQLDGELILNVQGDEPLMDPGMLDTLVARWQSVPCDLIAPVFPIKTIEEIQSSNVVKVARASDGRALYFSRSPIPFLRDLPFDSWVQHGTFWGHIGVYGYNRTVLANYYELPLSTLEKMEKLEQLRFLEAGYSIQTVETDYRPNSVDIADDLERVRKLLE
jgi:3-deoxy-manno-octulosonate cytidylyltransferase (CMP-KDO synthetase)